MDLGIATQFLSYGRVLTLHYYFLLMCILLTFSSHLLISLTAGAGTRCMSLLFTPPSLDLLLEVHLSISDQFLVPGSPWKLIITGFQKLIRWDNQSSGTTISSHFQASVCWSLKVTARQEIGCGKYLSVSRTGFPFICGQRQSWRPQIKRESIEWWSASWF